MLRTIFIALGAILLVALIATPIILIPGEPARGVSPIPPVDAAEQAATIAAMTPPKRERPVIAIVGRNDGTEVTDFLVSYGVLNRADVADVTIVAERAEPVRLYYPRISVDPDETIAAFDQRYPDGADYVVVPAMDPGTDPFLAEWIAGQHAKGAHIVSICNGSRMIGTAGLLDGRRATSHWSSVGELQGKYPTMEWVADRRYVTDDRVTTSTGISASIAVTLGLVEAIGGRDVAARVAGELGIASWDARHRSSEFRLGIEHMKTFVRNTLTLWRHETVAVPLEAGVDEIALGLVADAYSRTELADVVTVSADGGAVQSLHGLTIHPDRAAGDFTGRVLGTPSAETPALTLERELPRIAARYDSQTAAIVALTMEYPWPAAATQFASR